MFHKINDVAAQENYRLVVQFAEGVTKTYDVAPLFEKWPAFIALRDSPQLFYEVSVGAGGYGVVWNDALDLSCDELYANGQAIRTPFDGLMSFGDATLLWGLNESTLRKAIAYGKLTKGIDVCKFGKQWLVSNMAMKREYGLPKHPEN